MEQGRIWSSDSDQVEAVLAVLREMRADGYPYDDPKDRPFVRALVSDHPTVDVLAEVRKWRAWMLDHRGRRKTVRWRARLQTWIERSATYERERRQRGGGGMVPRDRRPGGTSTGSVASGAEAFGTSSGRLDQW